MSEEPHGWTHSCCDNCWTKMKGDRQPVRVVEAEQEECCFCGKSHSAGIFVRHHPADKRLFCNKEKQHA